MAHKKLKMFFLGLALGLGVVSTEETQNQPNILFVLADDLPWDHVGKSLVSSKT